MMKVCSICKESKTLESFDLNKMGKFGRRSWCKSCMKDWRELHRDSTQAQIREWHKNNPAKVDLIKRRWKLKNYNNLSLETYEQMAKAQNYLCAICKEPERDTCFRLCVDHNHVTGKVRGLLCRTCNAGIGYLKDNVELLRAATIYLETT